MLYNRRFPYPPEAVYIGRPSKWGNPYAHTPAEGTIRVSSREHAIEAYEQYLLSNPELFEALHELRGKDLVCWCEPLPCHGEILLKWVDKLR